MARPSQIDPRDVRLLAIYATRYALTRGKTTAPGDVTGIVLQHLALFAVEDLEGLARDVEMEERVAGHLPEREWDTDTWRAFGARLRQEIGKRAAQSARAQEDAVDEAKTEGTRERQIRGFGAMTREKQRAIASAGGKASHAKGTAHQWTKEEASRAGRKGVEARRRKMAGTGA